uniref:DUF2007 domain-containing protein n=1 Tax=Thermorudis peleae TaxID=1382356 RepID=A0A831TF76_9BACT
MRTGSLGTDDLEDAAVVPVAVAPNEIIAALWREALAEEGIVALVKATGPGLAYFTNFANEHVLYVLEPQAECAREILATLEAGEGP